jgi:hypothetical protein
MENRRGQVCIAFADAAWVRAEVIVIDKSSNSIHAVLHESVHFLGRVSDAMIAAFAASQEALLTTLRPDGSIFELTAPVRCAS